MISFLEAFTHPFFLRSLLCVVLLSMVFPLYGNLVLVRQEANIAHTFAHMGLLGIAVGLYFDLPLQATIIASSLVTVGFLYLTSRTSSNTNVTHNEIGAQLGLVGAILIVSQMSGYQADISSYLFGDILLLGVQDVYVIGAITLLSGVMYLLYRKNRYAFSLNPSVAKSKNITSVYGSLLYLIIIGMMIGSAMKILGVLLVSAFLILPSSIARLMATKITTRNLMGVGMSIITGLVALLLSRQRDLPSGASIIAFLLCIFLGIKAFKSDI